MFFQYFAFENFEICCFFGTRNGRNLIRFDSSYSRQEKSYKIQLKPSSRSFAGFYWVFGQLWCWPYCPICHSQFIKSVFADNKKCLSSSQRSQRHRIVKPNSPRARLFTYARERDLGWVLPY